MKTIDVPFVNLAAQYRLFREAILEGFDQLGQSSSFILGKPVQEFERSFAEFCQVEHCVGCANGTDALELALRALEIGSGAEVVLPANSFVATAEAVALTGARPVFVDIDPATYNLDPSKLKEGLTAKTRAIIAVHLYGLPAPMAEVLAFARDHGLYVVEDAAQAHGATYGGKAVGSLADIAAFSFYPTKNLGAMGDAGAVVTSSADLAERCRKLRNHGGVEKYVHQLLGRNSRLGAMQAYVLNLKLPKLKMWNERRREIARVYDRCFDRLGVRRPKESTEGRHVYHLYLIEVEGRDAVAEAFRTEGVETSVHYPEIIPVLRPFRDQAAPAKGWPIAEAATRRILSLPMYSELTDSQVELVVSAAEKILGR